MQLPVFVTQWKMQGFRGTEEEVQKMANEKRLIDANALLKKFQFRLPISDHIAESIDECVKMARQIINDAPTVDAVEWYEYDKIVNKLECLLCHATGGKYSKAGYSWEDMERMVTDYIEECCEEAVNTVITVCEEKQK